jgi:hypothetical protein
MGGRVSTTPYIRQGIEGKDHRSLPLEFFGPTAPVEHPAFTLGQIPVLRPAGSTSSPGCGLTDGAKKWNQVPSGPEDRGAGAVTLLEEGVEVREEALPAVDLLEP